LVHLIEAKTESDVSLYKATPTGRDEFSNDEEALAWDAEGWENLA
jgi:hypothetical protein